MSHIQSVLFDRKYYTVEQAKQAIKRNKHFKFIKTPRITAKFIRFRQIEPNYKKYHYVTNPVQHEHIELILGYPKKEIKGGGKGKGIPLGKALGIAKNFMKIMANKGIKLHIVGSLARKEPIVHDIDFITTNKLPEGRKYIKHQLDEAQIDVWYHKSLFFGKLLRSYKRHVIIALRKGLKNNGYKLSNDSLMKGKKEVKIKSVKEIFKLAGVTYKPIKS